MKAGNQRRVLAVLEARARLPDEGGGAVESWSPVGRHWVAIKAGPGDEGFDAGQEDARITHRLTLRGTPQGAPARPNAAQRFRIGAAIYDIRAVFDPDGRGRVLICLCEEGRGAS